MSKGRSMRVLLVTTPQSTIFYPMVPLAWALRAAGHRVQVLPRHDERLGHAHAIAIHGDGRMSAGSDPRSDGSAAVVDVLH